MAVLYFFACTFLVISYVYRRFALILYFKCVLNEKASKKMRSLSLVVYHFPKTVSDYSYFCKTSQGVVCMQPIGLDAKEVSKVVNLIENLSNFKYLIYSFLFFIIGLLYSINFIILSIFFESDLVKKMLLVLTWLQNKLFSLFFSKTLSKSFNSMVLI